MKIAFIGYGNMARALSGRWASQHQVFISGRDTGRAAKLATEVGASGSGSMSDAVGFGDIIVIATPAGAVEDAIRAVGADVFAGKVVIDINNPVSVPGGPHADTGDYYLPTRFDEGSLAEHIAALIPKASVVKAFNMCQASVWEMTPPLFDGRKLTALYCGDDAAAKEKVAGLIADLGCEAVDVGELKYARLLEAAACIVIKFLFSGRDMRTVLNLTQPEVKRSERMMLDIDELAKILRKMYEVGSERVGRNGNPAATTFIILFGMRYADDIHKCRLADRSAVRNIIRKAFHGYPGINEETSYDTEINHGMRIAEYIKVDKDEIDNLIR